MPPLNPSTGLSITNPLVLYRSLLTTRQIEPDPAQHRLALHLQKLYYRLKDYEPEVEYRKQLEQIGRTVSKSSPQQTTGNGSTQPGTARNGIFSAFSAQKERAETLALIKKYTNSENAMKIQSPQGLLLYGEVGTGKSMLVDLLADSLPTRKKRRWHFNTFMLDAYARLERLRRNRASMRNGLGDEENSMLQLARDMISTSPILFLDEFQLPDRASSKILSNLFTAFFHLGGVLVATSNRMPDELANATGIEFAPPPSTHVGFLGNRWGLLGKRNDSGRSENMFGGKSDFAIFLEVLKARCEVWDMEGQRDWRRREVDAGNTTHPDVTGDEPSDNGLLHSFEGLEPMQAGNWGLGYEQSAHVKSAENGDSPLEVKKLPKYYHLDPTSVDTSSREEWSLALQDATRTSTEYIPWNPTSLTVYGRTLLIPKHYSGVVLFGFSDLCMANLGPADYISIASNFHTLILIEVPVLTILQKNEARRLITLLDALYEARCKLLIRAHAGPDDLFFPETRSQASVENASTTDETYAETFSEIYQDSTAPFRPNISSYTPSSSPPNYAASPLPSNPYSGTQPHPSQRSILADEDSDFGPVYGTGRPSATDCSELSPSSRYRGVSDGAPGAGNEIGHTEQRELNFQRSGAFTGEDERFAYKRARSRLWEMCGARWWARGEGEADVSGWWKPVGKDGRAWERMVASEEMLAADDEEPILRGVRNEEDAQVKEKLQKTDAKDANATSTSPFRTMQEPPPKIPWTHAWGMMKWGKKAGAWGKGVEGLEERKKDGPR